MRAAVAPLVDSTVMLRRNLKHVVRNPFTVFNAIFFPAVLMLVFVYVFGEAFYVGVDYVDYATPAFSCWLSVTDWGYRDVR